MKYLRDATYVVGGYVVRSGRVLLLWHGGLSRWVPTGGRIELASGEYPHEALIREVRDETGLAVTVARAQAIARASSSCGVAPTARRARPDASRSGSACSIRVPAAPSAVTSRICCGESSVKPTRRTVRTRTLGNLEAWSASSPESWT